jgi:hypothetical protein
MERTTLEESDRAVVWVLMGVVVLTGCVLTGGVLTGVVLTGGVLTGVVVIE